MSTDSQQNQEMALDQWDPNRYLRRIDPSHVKFSKGFLRCRPEKWFPGFATQWLPLAHSLGVEIKVAEVQPLLATPKDLELGFAGTIDDEPASLMLDQASARAMAEAFIPGVKDVAQEIVLEYLARRCLVSLALAWSGPESSSVSFDSSIDPFSVRQAGAVKLSVTINNNHSTVYIVLGIRAVERLDGLWRRQVRSTVKQEEQEKQVSVEIGQLAVAPSELVNYLRSGTVIDLEVAVSDLATLYSNGKPWLPARLCNVDGNLGFEVIAGTVPSVRPPDGTTRISVEIGRTVLDSSLIGEMSQVGAIFGGDQPLKNDVRLMVNREQVAEATLCTFEGRYAVSVT